MDYRTRPAMFLAGVLAELNDQHRKGEIDNEQMTDRVAANVANFLRDAAPGRGRGHLHRERNIADGRRADYMCGCAKGDLLGACEHFDVRIEVVARELYAQGWLDNPDIMRTHTEDEQARGRDRWNSPRAIHEDYRAPIRRAAAAVLAVVDQIGSAAR